MFARQLTTVDSWYRAYKLMFKMMALRGYHPESHQRVTTKRAFADTIWPLILNPPTEADRFIVWLKEGESVRLYFGFYKMTLNKDVVTSITAFLENRKSEFNPAEEQEQNPERMAINIEMVIVAVSLGGYEAKHTLKYLSQNTIPRNMRNPRIAKGSIQVFLLDENFQCDPMDHVLNSEMRMITNEQEKERLRLRLVAQDLDKSKPLSQLIPVIYMDMPIAMWYGAQVGDVFYCMRSIGGENPYYRIVVPPAL